MVILIKGSHLEAKSGAFFHKGIYIQYTNRDRIKVNRLKMISHAKLKLHAEIKIRIIILIQIH